ncbi:hypothetical protein ACIRPP_11610 [Streptomyces sp. NPDC101219]
MPSRLSLPDSLPMTVPGKVRKVELRERHTEGTVAGLSGGAAPSGPG